MSWPEGRWGNTSMVGRARDIVTPRSGGSPIVIAEDMFHARLDNERTILAITADRDQPALAKLVGERGGGHLRKVLDQVMPEERRASTPLYLILDDISGTSLVCGWAWSQWTDDWLETMRSRLPAEQMETMFRKMEGICTGFAPGSSALARGPDRGPSAGTPTVDLRHPADPEGWHAFTVQNEVGMRRARRVDVTLGDGIVIDSAFQDSASHPDGGRMVLHEYRLVAIADPETLLITAIEAIPQVLPFPECPSAIHNVGRLVGSPLGELRDRVLADFKGTAGCTHLNDAMRSLAEVPALVEYLRQHENEALVEA